MNKPLIIFGTGKIAEVVTYYAMNECGFTVAAYTVDGAHQQSDTFLGKPVVVFERLSSLYPPEQYDMFVAVGYHDLNRLRSKKCEEARKVGYKLVSVVSPKTNLPLNVVHGDNCFIMPPCIVHPCVRLGSNVFVWSGAMIGHHSDVGDHCWFTSNCNIGGNVVMGQNCFVALNATVGHSVHIGSQCFLGANTLVTKGLADEGVVIAESSKPIKLNSSQFLKFSSFSSL
jgi:sugar O-acyltransferase (sialic acid O-acetyltransferase NeuD family)